MIALLLEAVFFQPHGAELKSFSFALDFLDRWESNGK